MPGSIVKRNRNSGKIRRPGAFPPENQRGCALILPVHAAIDQARENARGSKAIGTTGRGIGPAYEDKVARRGLRAGDLRNAEEFANRLKDLVDFHNFMLVNYYHCTPVSYEEILKNTLVLGELIKPMLTDVGEELNTLQQQGGNILFEGAQGALLDIDHGTYPYVTSSNTTAGGAATGSGVGPLAIDYVLGHHQSLFHPCRQWPFPYRVT